MLYNGGVQLKLLIYHLKKPYHFFKTGLLQALPAQLRYGQPQKHLTVIAITGTDGKTTTSSLVYHILLSAGIKVGLVSTVAAYQGEKQQDTGFHVTSPQPKELYKFMQQLVVNGHTHLVLEVTSHGIYQYRTWGIKPKLAGLTNISPEHLDYHITYSEYVKAKTNILNAASDAIINKDDYSYAEIRRQSKGKSFASYSSENQLPRSVKQAINKRFKESYNQMNARLAYRLALAAGVEEKVIAKAISTFPNVPGRMELVATKPCRIIVDFAHTPQAVAAALTTIKQQYPKGKLIAVLGSAGLRDKVKRPEMGRVATDLADLVVLTAEDPRTEDVWSIIRQMKEGLVKNHNKVNTVIDRKEAINFAINSLAKSKQDTVVILGKGHEQSMCYGEVEQPWSDQRAVEEIIKKNSKK